MYLTPLSIFLSILVPILGFQLIGIVHPTGIEAIKSHHRTEFSTIDPKNQSSIIFLGEISADDYTNQNPPYPIPETNSSFGWNGTELRGYIYQSDSEIIISFKGTSLTGPTSTDDKLMDNLMFSCCCGLGSIFVSPVCDCGSGNQCSTACLNHTAQEPDSYYRQALHLFQLVFQAEPSKKYWLTGHSLGGAIAGLVASATNQSAITFESPPVQRYARYLGLTPGEVYNFGSSLDPIFTGTCSTCRLSGVLLETTNHFGLVCVYSQFGISNVYYHQIEVVINNCLKIDPVPPCLIYPTQPECESWNF